MDVSELEKQIEQISNSADASRVKIIKDVMAEEVDVQDHSQWNPISLSEGCDLYIQVPSFLGCIPGSTGQAQCNLPIKMEVKHPPPSPFTREAFSESRSPCNPIAACAALASLMSKSSEGTGILSADHYMKGHIPPANVANNPMTMKLSNGEVATAKLVPNYESIVKELFPTKRPIKEPQILDASTKAWKWESKNEKSSRDVASSVGNHVSSTIKKKMSLPTTAEKSSFENAEMPLTNARRLTRSVVREIKERQTVETKNVTKEVLLTTSEQNLSVQKRDLLPDKETMAPIIDNKSGLIISDKFKNEMDKRGFCENNVSSMTTNGRGMQDLNCSRRLTRSAVNGRTKNKAEKPHKGLEDTRSDLEREISASPVNETCPNPNAKGYMKAGVSGFTKIAQKPGGMLRRFNVKCSSSMITVSNFLCRK